LAVQSSLSAEVENQFEVNSSINHSPIPARFIFDLDSDVVSFADININNSNFNINI